MNLRTDGASGPVTPPGRGGLDHVVLVDETLREGDARGYHTHTPEARAQLIHLIHEVGGINEFSLGMAVVNGNEFATLQLALEARRRGLLPSSIRFHVYGWFQIHDRCQQVLGQFSAEERSCISFDMALNASDTLSRSQDLPWLRAHGWLSCSEDAVSPGRLLDARASAYTHVMRSYQNLGLSGVGILLQDGFRSTEPELDACISAGLAGGGNGLRLHDTVGIATPPLVMKRLEHLGSVFPDTHVHVHFHDDFGMATANTLTGLMMGAVGADVTVNGIGNRAGNASTQEVLMGLKVMCDTALPGVQYGRLTELARAVEQHYALAQSPHASVTGRLVHLDESSIRTHLLHTAGDTTWAPYDPRDVGATLEAAHSSTSGQFAIELTLQRAKAALATDGVAIDPDLVARAYRWMSSEREQRADRYRPLALSALDSYQAALRSSYVTDSDLVGVAISTKGTFDGT